MHSVLLLLIALQCANYCNSWQGILASNGAGSQIWSPVLNPHGYTVDFGLPRYDFYRAARLSNGKVYFAGGDADDDGTTYIFDPTTNATVAGAKMNVPLFGN